MFTINTSQINNEKIDMVYLWCDGNEEAFKKRKSKYLKKETMAFDEEVEGEKRFFDNEELRYSLRSLEKYVPWINHVYIITDRQVPKWLNMNYEKVSIVDHSEILPPSIIPCFNSSVIEYFIAFIPKLSEKFLFGNDDTFFGANLNPDYFFTEGKPIVRVKQLKYIEHQEYFLSKSSELTTYTWTGNIFNALNLLNDFYKTNNYYQLHHNIDSYSKSAYLDTYKKFENTLKKSFNNKFRKGNDIGRILFSLDPVYSGKAKLKIISNPKPWRRRLNFIKNVNWESYCAVDTSIKDQKTILKFHPKLFCLNSDTSCTIEAKLQAKAFMENLFPTPSKFEL